MHGDYRISMLNTLTDNQKYRLISLPYRAGLYVSHSDQSGGDEANDNELRALENLIYGFSDGVFGSELVQDIMATTIKHKDEWKNWGQDLHRVPEECSDALSILSPFVERKEQVAYASRIMDIGEAVALAFREAEEVSSFGAKIKLYFEYFSAMQKAKAAKLPKRSFDEYLAISADEREALNALAKALNRVYI